MKQVSSKTSILRLEPILLLLTLLSPACSASSSDGAGSSSSGIGGATSQPTGGTNSNAAVSTNSGGVTNSANGGTAVAAPSGGIAAMTGGVRATGGSIQATGGTHSTSSTTPGGFGGIGGASTAVGGTISSTGDVPGLGGASVVGGASASGAKSAAGGASASGGKSAIGGSSSTDPCGSSNPAAVALPTIPGATFDVTTYGALGDDKTDNTKAIQAALTAAGNAGGGTVTIPKGTFLSGPIVLSSSTRLDLAPGAVLKMLPRATYPTPPTALITASGAHDIAVTGSGTIDGQGQDWWTAFAADSSISRPQEVSFSNSTRVQISGIRLQNSPEEHIWVKGDTDVTITGITISTLAASGQAAPKNTDGVDVTAKGMFFCNNTIACGDDNIAMSGTNLYIGYSTFGVGHGCSIGSITKNGVSGVTVDHLTMNGTTSGIRMKSARDRGGLVQNLSYTNITMTNVATPVYITSYYPTLPTDPTADTAQAITATTPRWSNISIKNLTATGATSAGIIWGLPEMKVANLTFDNVSIRAKTGMEIFHASGVSFVNGSSVTPASGSAVIISDASVTGVTTTNY